MTPLELEDIATELREGRPEPTPGFAAELDAWAAEGFPARAKAPQPKPTRPRLRQWLVPAIGFAGTAVLVIGIAVSQRGGEENFSSSGRDDSGVIAPTTERPASPTGDTAKSEVSGSFEAAAPANRVQEKSASMTLATGSDQVADVAQEASDVTERYGGIVDAMSVRTDKDGDARANLALRIPTENLGAGLGELSDLADVESRDEALLDITKSYNAAGKRFNHAQRRVNELVAALAGADDPAEIAGLKADLRIARQRLAAARAELRDNKQRGNFSRIRLTVISKADSGSTLGNAADDAVDVLEAIAGATLIGLAVLVPLGALGAALWFGSARVRRRRRESILDA
jgi:Domain of unknown function (DUF4349)